MTLVDEVHSTGARKNISALPGASSAISVNGAADETIRQSCAFVKNAFTMATADLPMPGGVDQASIKEYKGISLSFIMDFDFVSRKFMGRFDILYGFGPLYNEFACLAQEPNV